MKAQIQLPNRRLLDAWISYHPTATGGEMVLKAEVKAPYPDSGISRVDIFLDGHYVYSPECEFPEKWGDRGSLEQRISLNFAPFDQLQESA